MLQLGSEKATNATLPLACAALMAVRPRLYPSDMSFPRGD